MPPAPAPAPAPASDWHVVEPRRTVQHTRLHLPGGTICQTLRVSWVASVTGSLFQLHELLTQLPKNDLVSEAHH